ncbi:rhodanese-like domain-containing protein [Aliiglaciecola sp. CAU 1673]|uniref:rhodanese-like domain-containing protein n=1 Tax=Aliiglaciecola sp. CAU 1673 TaxID=3032595 RepID=UPI0023DA1A5A|nr:rhodanese-like domain-containing protein [Aliiglaciecola sp. CAU 1673]MDF2180086.1 rhodanese-like domain-containing protein [Aliiglaciecola sp. CAU 1673]
MIKSAVQLIAEAKRKISEVQVTDLEAQLAHQIVILDVREPDEFRQGFIPGAVNLPRGMLEMNLANLPQVKGAETPLEELAQMDVYLYCRSGARSALATESMMRMGFTRVYSVDGGFEAWKKADLRIELPGFAN